MRLSRTEYTVQNDRPIIHLFLREGNQRKTERVTNFLPYFYIPEGEEGRIDSNRTVSIDPMPYTSYMGETLTKVYVKLPEDVAKMRGNFSRTWEADVLFSTRYTIDRVDEIEPFVPKILYLDIETDNIGTVPNAKAAEYPIICVTIYNSLIGDYTTFVWKTGVTAGIQSAIFDDCPHEIRYFKDEREMLVNLVEFIRSEEPDIITGWNVVKFDLTYLMSRLGVWVIDSNLLSPLGSAYTRDYDCVIRGVSLIDLYDAYRKLTPATEISYKLDYIGKKVINIGKAEVTNVRWLWNHGLENLIKYNTQDVALCIGIDRKLGLIDYLESLRRISFCQLEDTLVVSRFSDSHILRLFHDKLVFPSKTHHGKVHYEGAYVSSWGKGVYSSVVNFDLRCHTPDTIVYTQTGAKRIDEVCKGELIFYIDGWVQVKSTHSKHYSGKMVQIKTANGRYLTISPEHKIPTLHNKRNRGLRDLKDKFAQKLRKNANVVIMPPPITDIDDFSLFTGILAAEGSIHTRDYRYYDNNRQIYRISHQNAINISIGDGECELHNIISYLIKKFHGRQIKWRRKGKTHGVQWTFNDKALVKKIQSWYQQSHNDIEMASFLKGFFEGDGTINKKHCSISITQCLRNKGNIALASSFLNKFGIKHYSNNYYINLNGKRFPNIALTIAYRSDILRFLSKVGFISNTKNIRASLVTKKRDWSSNPFHQLEKASIKMIDYDGLVYDLTLEDKANPYFLANCILSHNSLYPNIVCAANMSPDTLSHDGPIVAGKVKFRNDKKGVLPQVIEGLFGEREKYKMEMVKHPVGSDGWKVADQKQYAIKVLLNALYGQLSYAGSRIYEPKIGEAIAYMGREILGWSKDRLEEMGYRVLAVDTDSCFWMKENGQLTIDEIKDVLNRLNTTYDEFCFQFGMVNRFQMEFKKLYRKAFFGHAKKRYAGRICWQDGEWVDILETVGFETIRTDSSQFSRNLQGKVFEMILKEDKSKEEVIEYIIEQMKNFGSLDDIGIPRGIARELDSYKMADRKEPPTIRGAKYARDYLGLELSNKPKMVYVKRMPTGYVPTDAFCFDNASQIPPGTEIDFEKMLDKSVRMKLEAIFEALDWDLGELSPAWRGKGKMGEQMKLF